MKILGYDYRIVLTDAIVGATGEWIAKTQTVRIAADQVEQQIESTLLHEIIEVINYHLELGIEHKAIMAMEAALYQVLRDAGVDFEPLVSQIERGKENG